MNLGRRNFLKMLGISAGAASATALAKPLGGGSKVLAQTTPDGGSIPQQDGDDLDWRAIDDAHEEKVLTFLDQVGSYEGFWSSPMEYTMDGDTKVFEINVENAMWDTGGGKAFPAFTYNGRIPGPEIRCTEGDKLRFVVNNKMNQSTAIHWHGVDVPNDQDGVPYVTQPVIEPDTTYIYEFVAPNPGSHMYHSHHNTLEQVVGGLLGAFIIEPKDKSREPEYDHDVIMVLNDSTLGFTINGRGFPYVQPLTAKVGEKIRMRYMNEGLMIHPMHLHGQPQWVFMKDGYYLDSPYWCDTINIAPGERYDVIITARAPGIWAYHCHIISHVENRNGLFGMTVPFVVSE